MAEDLIGELHEDLILKILSSLPVKEAISTSVLSKKWQSRWKSVPKLKFDSKKYQSEHQTFSETVHKYLHSYEPEGLESLHLRLGLGSDKADPLDVVHWIKTAFALHLRRLVLKFFGPFKVDNFVFKSSLCTCDTLETLTLVGRILVDIHAPGSMKSLKTLYLMHVSYKNDESVQNLLSACPNLEELVVERSHQYTVKVFTIKVPSLQRLKIYDRNHQDEFVGYVIDAPSLNYLEIEKLRGPQFSLKAPELVEAYIPRFSKVIGESLVSVRRLVLNVLLSEEYCIDQEYYEWNKPKCVPECLLSHLETFAWRRYDWKKENEEEVAAYILKNSRVLKNATLSTNPIGPGELDKLKQRCRTRKKLDGVLRASNTCNLVFRFV